VKDRLGNGRAAADSRDTGVSREPEGLVITVDRLRLEVSRSMERRPETWID